MISRTQISDARLQRESPVRVSQRCCLQLETHYSDWGELRRGYSLIKVRQLHGVMSCRDAPTFPFIEASAADALDTATGRGPA